MAVGTGNISLSEVIAEVIGTQVSLQDCIDDATGVFDNTYYTAPTDRLSDFRGYGDIDLIAPSVPLNVEIVLFTEVPGVCYDYVNVEWSASTDNVAVSLYKIYKNGVYHATVNSPYTYYPITNQLDLTTCWAVTAVDAAGNESALSSCVTYVDGCSPDVVENLASSNILTTSFTLAWDASWDNIAVAGYKIYKGGVLYSDVGNVLTYNLTGITAGSTNTWTVLAYDASGNISDPSVGLSVVMST